MCRDRASIELLDRATDELVAACQGLCADYAGTALHKLYDDTVAEGVKPGERELLSKLQ